MAGLEVDPVQMQMSASACLHISEQVQAKITQIQNAVSAAADWKGRTRMALIEQVEQQRPVLTQVSRALEKGSKTLQTAGYSFLDQDETTATGIGQAGAAASQGGAPSALTGPSLNI